MSIIYTTFDDGTAMVGDDSQTYGNACSGTCPENVNIEDTYLNNYKVTIIAAYAFTLQNVKSVTLPSTIIEIRDSAFDTNSISSIKIPESVEYIGTYCFGTNQLTTVTIPAKVKHIGDSPFAGNADLQSIIVDENNLYYCNDIYGSLLTKDQTEFIEGLPKNNVIVIPETVHTLFHQSIDRYSQCTQIIILGNIRKYTSYSFYGLKNLEKVYYYGRTIVSTQIFAGVNTDSLTIHVCKDYPSTTFGNVAVKKSGYCPRKIFSCKQCVKNMNVVIFLSLFVCYNKI